MSDATPSEILDRGTARMRLAPGGNAKPPAEAALGEEMEDAPIPAAGVATSAMRAAGALVDVGAAARRAAAGKASSGDGSSPKTPLWLIACLAMLGGGGSHLGLRSLVGPDPEVAALTARMDAFDKAKSELAVRIDATEFAIADAEVARVSEVRFLIDLSVQGFGKLGVEREDLPAVPEELAARYKATEVGQTRRRIFKPPTPQPAQESSEPGTIPP